MGHIEAGAEKVIISAPGKGNLCLGKQESAVRKSRHARRFNVVSAGIRPVQGRRWCAA